MLDRLVMGEVPKKHHIALRDGAGKLRYEECLTRDGFEGPYTILYHLERPHTHRVAATPAGWILPQAAPARALAKRHYLSQNLPRLSGSLSQGRVPMLFNKDVILSMAYPTTPDAAYVVNGDADELLYVFKGSGVLRSLCGDLRYGPDDYVCIPRGMIYRLVPDANVAHEVLLIECLGGVGLLKQWRNDVGQLRMDAPYCHRDFRAPTFVGPMDEGIRALTLKKNSAFHGFTYETSPLDVVGFDGSVYPWAFNIMNFQPRAGLVHLPPTWHGTFGARGALICSFVPRMLDFHPDAIPCPYPHSSVDCDEFIFYCRGNFISRKGVGPGSISHHPAGIPHGPHPGAYEKSIGQHSTEELAVMLDTYEPLVPTPQALGVEDAGYHQSFI